MVACTLLKATNLQDQHTWLDKVKWIILFHMAETLTRVTYEKVKDLSFGARAACISFSEAGDDFFFNKMENVQMLFIRTVKVQGAV